MISEQIQTFWESLFDIKSTKVTYDPSKGNRLVLPLERNAIEQVNYANWVYGDGVEKVIQTIKELKFSDSPESFFQFDYSTNTFSFSQPETIQSDEFYFFFDYLKEKYRENDYKVISATKEGISTSENYIEIERYSLVNVYTQHSLRLEVINDRVNPPYLVGMGYPIDEHSSNINNPQFFRILKELIL